MQKIGTENTVCPTTDKSKWTREIHYNMNDKESKTPHTRTVLQNTFIYFALNWINLPFHPDPPLSNCHDLTYQAADSNAMQMQLCNFVTKIQKYIFVFDRYFFLQMVYILFPCWKVLPKAHFTKRTGQTNIGKAIPAPFLPLNNFQTHCIFIVVQLHPPRKQKSV